MTTYKLILGLVCVIVPGTQSQITSSTFWRIITQTTGSTFWVLTRTEPGNRLLARTKSWTLLEFFSMQVLVLNAYRQAVLFSHMATVSCHTIFVLTGSPISGGVPGGTNVHRFPNWTWWVTFWTPVSKLNLVWIFSLALKEWRATTGIESSVWFGLDIIWKYLLPAKLKLEFKV